MANNERLQNVLDHIRSHPQNWNQNFWEDYTSCGTTHCAAGWAAVLYAPHLFTEDAILDLDKTPNFSWMYFGQDILSLSLYQAEEIFINYPIDSEHNVRGGLHPTFEQYVAHVEKSVAGFTYDWNKTSTPE